MSDLKLQQAKAVRSRYRLRATLDVVATGSSTPRTVPEITIVDMSQSSAPPPVAHFRPCHHRNYDSSLGSLDQEEEASKKRHSNAAKANANRKHASPPQAHQNEPSPQIFELQADPITRTHRYLNATINHNAATKQVRSGARTKKARLESSPENVRAVPLTKDQADLSRALRRAKSGPQILKSQCYEVDAPEQSVPCELEAVEQKVLHELDSKIISHQKPSTLQDSPIFPEVATDSSAETLQFTIEGLPTALIAGYSTQKSKPQSQASNRSISHEMPLDIALSCQVAPLHYSDASHKLSCELGAVERTTSHIDAQAGRLQMDDQYPNSRAGPVDSLYAVHFAQVPQTLVVFRPETTTMTAAQAPEIPARSPRRRMLPGRE